ncbi:MAG: hypothetical protein ACXVCI_22315 [Bdellovibrionota bacterium]
MRKFLFSLALLACAQPAHAARINHLVFQGGTVHLVCTWDNGPNLSPTESLLGLEWKKGADHSAIEAPGSFKVELVMPAMGHGSSPTQINRVIDDRGQPVLGAYQVTGMYFTMAGDWEVRVTLRTSDGKVETQMFPVLL